VNVRTLFAPTLVFALALASTARADEPPHLEREWAALGAGTGIPTDHGDASLSLAEELGRHWIGDDGYEGFATGFLFDQELRFPSGGDTVANLRFQFRALWDFAIPIGDSALTLAPAVAAGVDLLVAGGQVDTAFVLTPHGDARFLFGASKQWFVYARVAVPIRFGSPSTTAEVQVLGGVGVRFFLL